MGSAAHAAAAQCSDSRDTSVPCAEVTALPAQARLAGAAPPPTVSMYQTDFLKAGGWGGQGPRQPLRRLPEALQDGVDVLECLVNLCSDFSTCADELEQR